MQMGGGPSPSAPLTTAGVDLSNYTQACQFMLEILDDTYLQVDGGKAARRFWYAVVVCIGLAAVFNLFHVLTQRYR